jgi:hypothetical protein
MTASKFKTIEDVKKAKITLESSIMAILKSFEDDTKLKVSYINVQRKGPIEKTKIAPELYEPYKGPITNISVEVNFDLLF